MGGGAAKGLQAAAEASTEAELKATFAGIPEAERKKLLTVLHSLSEEARATAMSVLVYGVPISPNCVAVVLLAMDKKVGKLEEIDFMNGAHKNPEYAAMNPFMQIPTLKDGEFTMGESNAMMRYIAHKYAPETYGGSDIEKKALIDWALDWSSTNFYTDFKGIAYATLGFLPVVEDQKAHNERATENLERFSKLFLSKTKFVAGDTPSIADYKCATLFWFCGRPAMKKHRGFDLPERIQTYVSDFMEACSSKDFLGAAEAFVASKE